MYIFDISTTPNENISTKQIMNIIEDSNNKTVFSYIFGWSAVKRPTALDWEL